MSLLLQRVKCMKEYSRLTGLAEQSKLQRKWRAAALLWEKAAEIGQRINHHSDAVVNAEVCRTCIDGGKKSFMTQSLSHYDHIFKKFLGDIAVTRDFLEIYLTPHLRKRFDFRTFAMASSSFIEDDLKGQCSDMLYSMKSTTGHDGYVYCLIEHQSRPEKLIAFRLLRYAVAAMQRHIEQGNAQLPVVIPLLFYHGTTSPYPYSTKWLDCFAEPELAATVYYQAFPLVDMTTIPDDEILTHRRVASARTGAEAHSYP